MNGEGGTAVKQILQAIENGALSPEETQRRLIELIQKEANRTDGPADEKLISACMDLMERFQGREHTEDEARIATLNQRIAAAIQEKKRNRERWRTTFRTVGAIAAVVVLLVGIGVPLRWTWFKSWSTPDEQQHVIMGNEITVDMVATAIAEHTLLGAETVLIEDVTQFDKILGFPLNVPTVLADNWVANQCYINYFPGYIKVSTSYANTSNLNKKVTCVINLYTDIDFAYFSFEQSHEGTLVSEGGYDLYVSDNMERASACWYDNIMYIRVVGDTNRDEIVKLTLSLIGGKDE